MVRLKILVAFDGSTTSLKAYRLTLEIVKKLSEPSEIHLLYVTDVPIVKPFRIHHDITVGVGTPVIISSIPHESIGRKELRRIHEVMEEALAEAEAYGVSVDFVVKKGRPEEEILREAEKGYDLLVVGGMDKPTSIPGLGHIAEAIVKRARCPVLVVK
ncbi:MAG: universal stress protein [Candidatus Bathyarchaeota archaeon]|nr:universal stress protein [Candidatus Bathyarchaeota archaeon]